jgi:hypothetical protein
MGLGSSTPGSPRETLRALNTELATWETLAQVSHHHHVTSSSHSNSTGTGRVCLCATKF